MRFGKVVLEVEDVPQIGAAPLVDRLIRIADDAEVAVARRRAAESAGTAGGSCPGTRRPSGTGTSRCTGRAPCSDFSNSSTVFSSRSSKSSAFASLQRLQVHARTACRSAASRGFHEFAVNTSGPSIRFFAWLMRDSASARLHAALSSTPELPQRLLDHRELVGRVVDDEVARQADVRRLAAQQPRAQRVERRDPHLPAVDAEQRLDARAHLLGGLVGEGDGQDAIRLGRCRC